jgi:hypothetical protein
VSHEDKHERRRRAGPYTGRTPVLAGDTFHALSQLSAAEQAALTPLPDDQLATVEAGEVSLEIGASLILFPPSDFAFPSPSTCCTMGFCDPYVQEPNI